MTAKATKNPVIKKAQGGWFSSAPYLVTERSHHALSLMDKKQHLDEFLHHFR